MNNTIDKQKKIIKIILPALIVLLCYVISVRYSSMVYLTNDDTSIQDTLAGNMTGQPYPMHQFINVLIAFPIAMLYKVLPTIQWWYVWSHFLVILGMLFINYSIVIISKKNDFPYVMSISLFTLIDVIFVFYTISNISFTIVPAILGAGVIAMIFMINDKNRKIIALIGSFCFIAVLCHRAAVGKIVLCYILLSIVHYFINRKSWKKDFSKLCFISAVLLCLSICIPEWNSRCYDSVNGSEFQEYNSARGNYMDYSHDSFEENPEIYESVGWDYDVYRLVQSWCFLDDNVNAESFRYLYEQSNVQKVSAEAKGLSEYVKKDLNNSLSEFSVITWLLSVFVCLLTIGFGNQKLNLITLVCNIGGTLILIIYQIYSGRILYRTLIAVLIPSIVINVMLIIESYSSVKNKKMMHILFAIFVGVSTIGSKQIIDYTFDTERLSVIEESLIKDQALKEYAISNKDNIYIKQTTITPSISPYDVDSYEKVTNIIHWGDSTFYSDGFRKKLAINGIDKINGSVFMRDNVFLISDFDAMKTMKKDEYNIFGVFYSWLQNHYNAIGFFKVDTICEGIYVYKFVFEDNMTEYDDYYDYIDENLFQIVVGK